MENIENTENNENTGAAAGGEPAQNREQRKMRRLLKSGPAKAALSAALVAALGMGGMLAYFTGTDTVVNKFTVSEGMADGQIQVVELSWDATDADGDGVPDAAQDMVPLQTVAKDPAVRNNSDIAAWCFAKVKVPTAEVSVLGEDGTPMAAASHELFAYEVNEGWAEVGQSVVEGGFTTHTYLWGATVAPGGATAAIFDDVTLVNLVEAQGTSGAQDIEVTGSAIQAEGFGTVQEAYAAWQGQTA